MGKRPTEPVDLYAWLKQEIARLEQELDELKDDIFKVVDKEGGTLERGDFVFRTQKRPRYKFSDKYEKKNDELKELKKKEIDEGTAKIEGYSEFVTVKPKKKED